MSEPLRAGDADRESVADVLRRAHVDGRLDTAELEDRLERCYAAKTYAELDRLVRDLPQPRPRPGQRRPSPRIPIVAVPLALGLLALAVATHGHVFVIWPLLFFLVVRAARRRPRWR
jgi:hypothetical protein